MRYVVVGAGAVGGTIGALLHRSGADVTFVARGAHADALVARGLRFDTPGGSAVLRIRTVRSGAEAGVDAGTAVVLATKAQDTPSVLDGLFGRGGAAAAPATVVCAQNGVVNERWALRFSPHVTAMCVMLPAEHLEPGLVAAYGAPRPGLLDVGLYPSGTDATVDELAADLARADFDSVARADVMRWKYRKLLNNLGNVLDAALGPNEPDLSVSLWVRAVEEAREVYAAAGIPCATDEEDRERRADLVHMAPVGGARRGGGSTWQSVAHGAPTLETPYLNGEIVLLGRLHGVPTPVNAGLCAVGRRLLRARPPAGGFDAAEVLALVDGAEPGA